ncbi:Retrovirus-related Pol polyprotein from transposon TNT 1-94 [Gossypium australe]|uniref:Retrovirus-related Pol polyprotein from transposon TNT 1-94 n=1 Tax=Gossypium australe TaxID=47621 RepID=A0A5B6X1Y8_9ROSI|nr:Retrovirus-related Pol polyprotein from transposon TNT 1-94 [Gossypium australe]
MKIFFILKYYSTRDIGYLSDPQNARAQSGYVYSGRCIHTATDLYRNAAHAEAKRTGLLRLPLASVEQTR